MEAAKILGCSYLELDSRPDKFDLMDRAFTYRNGTDRGEYMRELNPKYQKQRSDAMKEVEAARK
jgi:hypothetical protein